MHIPRGTARRPALIAALVISVAAASGSVAFAGNGDGGADAGRDAKIAAVCADPDQAVAKMTERQAHINKRITRLTELRAKAEGAGRTKLVARIDHRLDRLNTVLDHVTARIAEAPAWIAEHCS